ncbi:efflux RND transporter periplasmic adaptor subunit [Pedobacter sp. L105]|uniref:efflux RND transporter periplasmic adaptor subunit n=1 Tax=Pedobacter sp. L105 TaxID=1641871 RepID=UPI00131C21F3|nr:efflux RND transporter periplasmic adaptor subunit [Pedobacter sp. L105]
MKGLPIFKHITIVQLGICLLFTACTQQETIIPQRKEIVDAVFGSGHIENNDQYNVMANTEGYIKASYVAEGDSVKSNQHLFRLSNEVQQTQVGNALTNLEFAKKNNSPRAPQIEQLKIQISQAADKKRVDSLNEQRYSRLVKTHAVSAMDYDNALLTYQSSASSLNVLRKNLADLQRNVKLSQQNASSQYQIQQQNNDYNNLNSKAGGVVMNISKKVGDYVKKGDAIALIGAGKPIIKLYIAEDDIQRIQPGQVALISLNSVKDYTFKAVVTKIYPAFNNDQQSFIVEASFTDQPANLLNGTQLQANVIIQTKKDALVIPSYYLINGDYVLLKGSKDKKAVKTGIRTLEWTEITAGISTDDVLTLPKQK